MSNIEKHLEGTIEYLHADGSGVFYTENKKQVRVYHTAPQEKTRVTVQKRQNGILRARLDEVLIPSPQRIIPVCPHANTCGGCKWQHLCYSYQLTIKQDLVAKTFAQAGLTCSFEPLLACPEPFFYRNRMDYSFDYRGNLGLKQPGYWWSVVNIQKCFLLSKETGEILERIRNWCSQTGLPFWDAKYHRGFFRNVVIREGKNTHERLIALITTTPEFILTNQTNDKQSKEELVSMLQTFPETLNEHATSVVWGQTDTLSDVSLAETFIPLKNNPWIYEEINGLRYRIYPGSFFQTNTLMAKQLQDTVLAFAGDISKKRILDLYCGAGFFSLAFAKKARKVIGIELDKFSIISAKENTKENGLSADFFVAKAEEYPWEKNKPDLVLLDPPRAGLHPKVLKTLLQTLPKEIILVSCNYRSLVKELPKLLPYYHLQKIQALDLFPQTPHVEVVVKLTVK